MQRKLIILGNGFDLQSGLESSFNQFFEVSEKEIVEKWINGNLPIKEVSLISLLLYNAYYRNDFSGTDWDMHPFIIKYNEKYHSFFKLNDNVNEWMDVEQFLFSLVNSENLPTIIDCFQKTYKSINYRVNGCVCNQDNVNIFFNRSLNGKGYFSISSFFDFLTAELKLFENRFVNFLLNQINEKNEYKNNSKIIISDLCGDDVGEILNFNYTHVDCPRGFEEINVHGSIDKTIIMGIDAHENIKDEAVPFTKSFRKMIENENRVILSGIYNEIIIYGHSLNKQDYSYFQSIFDYVNIYSSKTKITLINSDNFITEEEYQNNKHNYRIEMAKRLFDLIRTYGSTMNNKDNGRNLLHKMLLEGRIKMELKNYIEIKS